MAQQKEMRRHVVRFLLETEQSYVQSLRTIIRVGACVFVVSFPYHSAVGSGSEANKLHQLSFLRREGECYMY